MMPKVCTVVVNGRSFPAKVGDVLLDAALASGVDISHDCRSGYCGACRVNIVSGRTYGGDDGQNSVRACQCRILSDLHVSHDDLPAPDTICGEVNAIHLLTPDTAEVVVSLEKPSLHLAGQHYSVQFRGFPARYYSPTDPLQERSNSRVAVFHIRLVAQGTLSNALKSNIGVGHRVTLTGPHGHAYFRPDHPNRVICVSTGQLPV
jgi:ferredoxin